MPPNEKIMKMSCMKFARTQSAADNLACNFKRREQINIVTSFLDCSQVYGSSFERSNSLRTFNGGLKVILENFILIVLF